MLPRALNRAMSTTARAASAAAGKDNPKFYSMVLEFTEESADILENKLLQENEVQLGRSSQVMKDQYEERFIKKISTNSRNFKFELMIFKILFSTIKGYETIC